MIEEPDIVDRSAAKAELAPSGTLRAAINLGNSVLAQRGPHTGEARGVSVALATELAKSLDAPHRLILFEARPRLSRP